MRGEGMGYGFHRGASCVPVVRYFLLWNPSPTLRVQRKNAKQRFVRVGLNFIVPGKAGVDTLFCAPQGVAFVFVDIEILG